MDEFQKFKVTYLEECKELLKDMEGLLVSLDVDDVQQEDLHAIFRCAHSIKGGAGAFNLTRISEFTHVLENVLDNIRNGEKDLSKDIVDLLLESRDALEHMVFAAEEDKSVEKSYAKNIEEKLLSISSIKKSRDLNTNIISPLKIDKSKFYNISFIPSMNILRSGNEPMLIFKELRAMGDLTVNAVCDGIPDIENIHPDECYMKFDMELDTVVDKSIVESAFEFVVEECELKISEDAGIFDGNIQVTPIPANDEIQKNDDIQGESKHREHKVEVATSIRVDVEKIDKLVNLVGELVITQAMINAQSKDLPYEEFGSLIDGVESLSQYTRELQDAVMSVRMQPVKSIFSRMPRLVRDLARKLDKEIELELYGEGTEVDKTIIEKLSDPLTHLIRNSADHGIETKAQRIASGKPESGIIRLSADHMSGKIVITIQDDGAGINREKVLAKAIEKGVVSKDEAALFSDEQIDQLIFAPGFSTAQNVSDISGRGVGMDVVKKNIESIGGYIKIANSPGKGLSINIYIPLTLAILDGMIVSVGKEQYIIPISAIVETLRPVKEDLKKIADGNDIINVRGEFLPLYYLYNLFNIKNAQSNPENALVVIIDVNNSKYGLVVDELVAQQQVVIKSLDEFSKNLEGVSGATILGDGKVSLILDMLKIQTIYNKLSNSQKKVA